MFRRALPLVLVAAVVLALLAAADAARPRLTPVERGRRLAEANGCFACHGPEGSRGIPNPGRADLTVPGFTSTLMMYAENEEQVREWIRDGGTKTRKASKTWRAEREQGTLRMPAFGKRLTEREIDDLVAFVLAAAGQSAPADSLPAAGLERAAALGCFGCHGMGGRYARPNPGSFKGFVPPWDGPDFPELVADRGEFQEWVEEGVSRRFKANRAARFFLRRPPLHMPAYKKQLQPGDLNALWAYVTWLRTPSAPTP
ncbi:MAG TPA: c-type cytochrome [Candidatus Eisenbacteria bacterium]|nr:c-type cytochrome [Candidatus Eisenbacteria bacterium]